MKTNKQSTILTLVMHLWDANILVREIMINDYYLFHTLLENWLCGCIFSWMTIKVYMYMEIIFSLAYFKILPTHIK